MAPEVWNKAVPLGFPVESVLLRASEGQLCSKHEGTLTWRNWHVVRGVGLWWCIQSAVHWEHALYRIKSQQIKKRHLSPQQ